MTDTTQTNEHAAYSDAQNALSQAAGEERKFRNAQESETETMMWEVMLNLREQAAGNELVIRLSSIVMEQWSTEDNHLRDENLSDFYYKHRQRRARLNALAELVDAMSTDTDES